MADTPRVKHTAFQYTEAIRRALAAGDIKAVHGLLTLMALDYPREAEDLRQTMLLGLAIVKEQADG